MGNYKRLAVLAALCMTALFLSGCGAKKSENTDQGMTLISALDYEGALACFEAARVNNENLQDICRGEGIAYMGLTRYEEASAVLEEALSLSGYQPTELEYDINYYLAAAYYKQGKTDEAVEIYEAITALKPKEKDAWYLLGVLRLEKGQTDKAKAAFDQAVAVSKNDYDLLIDIFCSCSQYGQKELGESYLEAVISSKDKKLSDLDKGRISFYLEDYEEARNCLEEAKDTGGELAASLLGQTYEKLEDYNYAASVYSNYLETRQPSAEIYNQLGLCKLKLKDYQGALSAFQAGLSIEGSSLTQVLKYNEIVAYEYLGEFDQACVLIKQYLANYPDDQNAIREYEFLQTR